MKTRKITVHSKLSDRSEIQKKYSIDDYQENDLVVSYTIIIEDTSENLKKLCQDPKILDWSDSNVQQQEPMKEVSSVDLITEDLKKTLKSIDTKDMKTIINLLLCLNETIDFNKGTPDMTPELIISKSLKTIREIKEPVFSEGLVKLVLRCMAYYGKKEFDSRLLESMTRVTENLLKKPSYISEETFIRNIFECDVWKEVN